MTDKGRSGGVKDVEGGVDEVCEGAFGIEVGVGVEKERTEGGKEGGGLGRLKSVCGP